MYKNTYIIVHLKRIDYINYIYYECIGFLLNYMIIKIIINVDTSSILMMWKIITVSIIESIRIYILILWNLN